MEVYSSFNMVILEDLGSSFLLGNLQKKRKCGIIYAHLKGVRQMDKKLIEFYISGIKEEKGLIDTSVKDSEIAYVQAAYSVMQHTYHERDPRDLLRSCCETLVESEVKHIACKMALMISTAQLEMGTIPFSVIDKNVPQAVPEYYVPQRGAK